MSGSVTSVTNRGVAAIGGAHTAATAPASAATQVLPAPNTDAGAASGDVMALLYLLTAGRRDAESTERAASAERKGSERKQAFEQMQIEIQKAKDAKEDGGWLSDVTNLLDAATDALVGGNPLQDVANKLSESTGFKGFEIAYDFIRPDAIMHGAAVLASAATDQQGIAQGYDVGAASSSLKTRFQGAADVSGEDKKVMDAYAVTRDSIAAAMITVGTCGVGTAAVVAIAGSAALMLESKADLLGEAGVGDKEKMWIRVGAQVALLGGTFGASLLKGGQIASQVGRYGVDIVNGTNKIARGSVEVGQAVYQKAADDHLTESAKHQNTQQRVNREQDRIIDGLRAVSTSYQRMLENIAGAMNERDQIPLMITRQIA